ncbi:MAG TPA: tetratricopeptide repeat protein [Saprospiraceae bacterium]|nr:tetratricopeptide repeat protein [Saprospiraceae bacterium]
MEELYPRIEDYLDNALTDAERAAFEADVQADPASAAALEQVREARERLSRHWTQESAEAGLREQLSELGNQHFGTTEQPNRNARRFFIGRWWMAAAATVAALIVWLAWPPGNDALYTRYRAFPEASFTLKSSDKSTLDKAADAFNDKNFSAALSSLNTYLLQQPNDQEARFFSGLCQLELSRFTEAEAIFREIISADNAWSGEARWYLALTYLRSKKMEDCKSVLQEIQQGGAHYNEAQELLGKI